MTAINRRAAMGKIAGSVAGCLIPFTSRADDQLPHCTLGYSTYAIPDRPIRESLKLIAGAGYDSVEICVMRDRDTSPDRLDARQRKLLAGHIRESGLRLTSLIANLRPGSKSEQQSSTVSRLKSITELARDLDPDRPALIQTVLGGKDWMAERDQIRDRIGEWVRIADAADVLLCIKPHRSQAMSRPSEFVWLFEQLGRPQQLRMAYDYSHFAFRDLPLSETIKTALPVTAHIAVKDAVQQEGRVQFKLPGEAGTIDYASLLKQFYAGGFRGDVCVEVSSQVWRQPDYDVQQALKTCYQNMSVAFNKAGVPRP